MQVLTCLVDEQLMGKRNIANGNGLLNFMRRATSHPSALVQPMKWDEIEDSEKNGIIDPLVRYCLFINNYIFE